MLTLQQTDRPGSFRPTAPDSLDATRLCGRFRSLIRKGKLPNVVATAIARELSAFIWAINREVMAPGEGLEIRDAPTARSLTPCSPRSRRGLATAEPSPRHRDGQP
jgi:hypothetical protein